MNARFPVILVTSLALLGYTCSSQAQGTAFTYQGRLMESSGPANGLYDIYFSVYDASTAGTQVAPPITISGAGVSNGLFTATLDFGPGVFQGSPRWLELAVRTNGAASFNPLLQRQPLTAAPYAIFAGKAATVDTANWSTVSGVPLLLTSNSISTIGANALSLRVAGVPGFRIEPDPRGADVPNVVGGWSGNSISTNGAGGSVIVGGGYAGIPNTIQDFSSGAFIGAGSLNLIRSNANDVVIAGGFGNTVGSARSVIGGGGGNTILGDSSYDSVIGGGNGNYVSNSLTGVNGVATIGGGFQNYNYGWAATIAGGWNHIVTGTSDFIGGGSFNTISNSYASIMGGYGNNAWGAGVSIGGGYYNRAAGVNSVIAGGTSNVTSNDYAVVSGGAANTAFGFLSTSVGGQGNSALVNNSTVVGGLFNTNAGVLAFIGAGYFNSVSNFAAAVGGGQSNVVMGGIGTISGGSENTVSGNFGSIGGGQRNSAGAAGSYSTVGGGFQNSANGTVATVPGGQDNLAQGNTSFAAGTRAKALHDGSFVWGDLTFSDFQSTAPNQFLIRAAGGVGINNNNPATALDVAGTVTATGFSGNGAGLANVNAATLGGLSSSSFWSTAGNAGTSPGANFIGTTDNQALLIRGSFVGVGRATRITGNEYFGITAPVGAGTYGGMYINTTNSNALPFYGYSQAGTVAGYHFVDGSDTNKWKLVLGSVRMTVTQNGFVGIGTTLPDALLTVNGAATKPGGGAWGTFSDLRLKKEVQPLNDALTRLMQLRGVSFEYRDPEAIHELPGRQIGMIAQEVEKVFPDWVEPASNGMKRLSIHGFEALVVEALRELREEKDAKIAELERELASQKEAQLKLEKRLSGMERALSSLAKQAEMLPAGALPVTAKTLKSGATATTPF